MKNIFLQDLTTKDLLAVGRIHQRLYKLNKKSFSDQESKSNATLISQQHLNKYEVWPRKLGHVSRNKVLHLNVFESSDCDHYVCTVCPIEKQ